MPYTLRGTVIDKEDVGQLYHMGIGTTSPGQSTPDNLLGYMLLADAQLGRFIEKTDLHSKDQLTSYSSEALIDRDFVNTPRTTDGDFSGGALQQNYIDAHRFWDSDLDIRVPGYLSLRAAWQRRQLLGVGALAPQSVAFNNDVFTTFGGTAIYNSAGTAYTPGITAKLLDTDGDTLFVADGVNSLSQSPSLNPAGAWTVLSAAIGAIKQMWVVNLGTNGRFVYYTTDNRSLLIFDLNAGTAGAVVPLGGATMQIVDVVPYQARVAVLTKDPGNTGFDVWYHDGLNLQHIIRVNQYVPSGLCAILGQLFMTARAASQWESPILARIGAGTFEIILRAGMPFAQRPANAGGPPVRWWNGTGVNRNWWDRGVPAQGAGIGAPYAGDQYVYFTLQFPQINGITSTAYVGVYDVLSGSYSHLGSMDATDAPQVLQPRQLAVSSRAVAFPMVVGGVGSLQYQVQSASFPTSTVAYQASGWLCTSRFDFNTPSIAKLFRRIIVHHAPLNAGEAILVNAYIDTDPMTFSTSLAVFPVGATLTNNTPGSSTTILTLPARTIGHSLFFALQLTAGTGQQSSPQVFYASVEVAVPWTWEGWFDLTHKRRMLNGDVDTAATVQDLYWLLHNAWENAQLVTVYHPNGDTYVAAIESLEFQAPNPVNERTPEHGTGVEWWVHILLRDSLV